MTSRSASLVKSLDISAGVRAFAAIEACLERLSEAGAEMLWPAMSGACRIVVSASSRSYARESPALRRRELDHDPAPAHGAAAGYPASSRAFRRAAEEALVSILTRRVEVSASTFALGSTD